MHAIAAFDLAEARTADPDTRARIAAAMGEALETRGCFFVAAHGIDDRVFEAAQHAAGAFFDLPFETKRRAADPNAHGLTGYSLGEPREAYGRGTEPPDMWHIGRDLDVRTAASPGNPWPDRDCPTFRPAMEALRDGLDACAASVLSLLSVYLYGDEASLVRAVLPDGLAMLRMMRYPPHTGQVVDRSDRSEPHADTCLITVATGGTVPGLEVATPDGGYEAIAPGHARLLVSAGRMLELLTNGCVRGLKHRATWYADVRGARLAMPYFLCPTEDFTLEPLPRFVARVGTALYDPFTTIEFVRAVTAFGDTSYRDHQHEGAIVGTSPHSDPVSIEFARRGARR